MSAEACADANLESLKAQIEEIEALQCMYPDEGARGPPGSLDALF